jgi:hypothetical protein
MCLGLVLLDLSPVQAHKSQKPLSPHYNTSHIALTTQLLQSVLRHGTASTANAYAIVLASRLGSARPKQCAMLLTAHNAPLTNCRENPTKLGSIYIYMSKRLCPYGDKRQNIVDPNVPNNTVL